MSTISSVCLRRLLPAALLAVAATLGGSAIGNPAIACAAPDDGPEWDIGRYEACMAKGGHPMDCCINSDGDWITTDSTISTDGYCVAPPYNPPADALPAPPPSPPDVVGRPGVTPPQEAATQAPMPAPIVTFTPVPANPG